MVKWLFTLGLLALALPATYVSWRDYRAERLHAEAETLSQLPRSVEGLKRLRGLVNAAFVRSDTLSVAGQVAMDVGLRLEEPERTAILCESLSYYGRALKRDPWNARTLVSWGNARQVLGHAHCAGELTAGEYEPVLQLALRLSPKDALVQYSAGLVYLYGRREPEAYALFQRALTYGVNLGRARHQFIYGLATTPDALRELIPAQFPQMLQYSRFWAALPTPTQTELASVLADLQRRGAEQSRLLAGSDLEAVGRHTERMLELLNVCATDGIRTELDRRIALLLRERGDGATAQGLEERAQFGRIGVVLSTKANDKRPEKSPLTDWNRDSVVAFDEANRTVGFFLRENAVLRLVELSAAVPSSEIMRQSLRIYSSEDNSTWVNRTESIRLVPFQLGDRHGLWVWLPPFSEPYWKVHFQNSANPRSFVDALKSMVKVYGIQG